MTKRPSVLPLLAEIAISLAGRLAKQRDPPPPPDTCTPIKAAWIGFAGSVLGAGIAGAIAFVALGPAFKQTEAAQRSAAVAAGQILRDRFKAANEEAKVLTNGHRLNAVPTVLTLDPEDVGRIAWLARHPDQAALIRDFYLPFLDGHLGELIDVSFKVDLHDLERGPYISAVSAFRDILRTTMDGRARRNGAVGQELNDQEWRAHVDAAAQFAWRDWLRARLIYNTRINAAQNILRIQILEADRMAMGEDAARLFREQQQAKIPMDDHWPPSTNLAPSKP